MMLSKKNLKKIETVLIGLIIVSVFTAGWQIINSTDTNQHMANDIPNIDQPTVNPPAGLTAKYRNPQIGLEFYYPKNWQAKEQYKNQQDINDGIDVSVTSPSGLTINLNGHYTGTQPGTCEKNIYDKPHITSSCSTLEVVAKELLPVKTAEGDVFLVAAKFTPPNSRGNSQHLLFLSSDPNVVLSQNPLVGVWPNYGTINTGKIYIDSFLSGIDNSNPGYYRLPEMIIANDILQSVNLF